MSNLYDYTICIKKIKLNDIPSDLSLQIECGADSIYVTPLLVPNGSMNYTVHEIQQQFICRQCKEKESILFTWFASNTIFMFSKYDLQENGTGITLEGAIPFTKLIYHHVIIGRMWLIMLL